MIIKTNKKFDKFIDCLESIWKDRNKIENFSSEQFYDYQNKLINENRYLSADLVDVIYFFLDDLSLKKFKSKKEFLTSALSDDCFNFYDEFVKK